MELVNANASSAFSEDKDMDESIEIRDEGTTDRYFHVMLNMADDELDPYQYRLLGHYRRVCGARNVPCTESTRTTAEKCKMSVGQVSTTRQELAASGWITLGKDGNRTIVTLVDRMPENVARYTPQGVPKKRSPDEHSRGKRSRGEHSRGKRSPGERNEQADSGPFTPRTNRSSDEQERSPHEQERSSGERKKELIKKELIKEPPTTSSGGEPASSQAVDDDDAAAFIRAEAEKLGLSAEWRDVLASQNAEHAVGLLITAQRRSVTNPAGLLITMLRQAQPPATDAIEAATLALELRTLEQDRLEREQRQRSIPVAYSPLQLANTADDDRSGSTAGRDIWQATLGQLQIMLNQATFETWLKGTTAERYEGGKLTVRARHAYGKDWLEQRQHMIEQVASNLAGFAVRVVFEPPVAKVAS